MLHFRRTNWQLLVRKRQKECETTHCIQALAPSRSYYSVNCICCIIRLYKMLSDESALSTNGGVLRLRLWLGIGWCECWNLIYKGDFFENQFLCYRTKLYWMKHKKHNYVCYSRRGFGFFINIYCRGFCSIVWSAVNVSRLNMYFESII